jgi:3-phosphoshikimate 1-carboxyvinyltransferase
MQFIISNKQKKISSSIELPASKSISNRILIINALCSNPFPTGNLSDSDDTQVLKKALFSNDKKIDIGHAGTAMRFLTAFLSMIPGEWEVTGSERMKQRPIKILVDALNQLGAKIIYLEKEGYPPLKIYGSHLKGQIIELNGSVSSQYISALLMIAPAVENGLTLKITGNITSSSYIKLTLSIMSTFGIKYEWSRNKIIVPEQKYLPFKFKMEGDWSSASYWYQILAMATKGEIFIKNLNLNSIQGDARITEWFELFGITSTQKKHGVLISKSKEIKPDNLQLDFIENPDIAQTMSCLCVAKKIPFHFYGLKTLKIKETDRIYALKNELLKFGAKLNEPVTGELEWNGTSTPLPTEHTPVIKTYNDHRMALSFAPLALAGKKIIIDNPTVVAKSYPLFWKDLQKAGFKIISVKYPDKL